MTFAPAASERFSFFTSSPAFGVVTVFNFSYSDFVYMSDVVLS